MTLTLMHPGDLSASEWLTVAWYWVGIPVVVFTGLFRLSKLSKWSGRKSNNASDKPKT